PHSFVKAIAAALNDAPGTECLAEPRPNVVISHIASFFHRHISASLSAFENGLHLLEDLMWLERLAIVLENLVIHSHARLGSEMAGELARVVGFDANRLLAAAKNLCDFLRVKRDQVLDLKLIRPNAFG